MKKVNTSFDKSAQFWDSKIGVDGSKMLAVRNAMPIVFGMLGKFKGKRAYDIACGNGFLSRRLVAAGAKEVWASDISSELVNIAQAKYSSDKIKYLVREATDFTKIPKAYFDAVVINQGIFYIHDLDSLFAGIYKVLKPGGLVIFNMGHPLFFIARQDMGLYNSDQPARELLGSYRKYLKSYTHRILKKWNVNGSSVNVDYYMYKRPLEEYINALGRNNLLVSEIAEPKTRASDISGKAVKSEIPSEIIVKAVKV
jgi:ubiquinone/menaquinone biosynthesis C-methylase UbiE